MLLDMIRSIPKEFIAEEQRAMGSEQYILSIMKDLEREETNGGIVGKIAVILQNSEYEMSVMGFLSMIQLLRHWAEKQGNKEWLSRQCWQLNALNHDEIGLYVVPFLDNPKPEMRRLTDIMTVYSPLAGFIDFQEKKLADYAVGAYLIIGLLFYAEKLKGKDSSGLN